MAFIQAMTIVIDEEPVDDVSVLSRQASAVESLPLRPALVDPWASGALVAIGQAKIDNVYNALFFLDVSVQGSYDVQEQSSVNCSN